MERERKFKYEWRRTWPDSVDDFSCWEGGYCVGRVTLRTTGPLKAWTWSMGDDRPGRIWSANGSALTRDEACHALEAAFDHDLTSDR